METKSAIMASSVEKLKNSNIRITPQRYAVLEYLIQSESHPTADEIYQSLSGNFPNMSVATVYNNLKLFTKIGFVQEMTYGDASSRFDFSCTQHYHAVCENCGKVTDFHYPELDELEKGVQDLVGFKIVRHRLEVYGLCPECQKAKEQ